MAIASAGNLKMREIVDLSAPRDLPLVGNEHQSTPSGTYLILERWAQVLGTPYRFQIGSRPVTVWDDAELSHSIMRERPYGYRLYSPIEETLDKMGSNGVFSVEGAAWEPQRILAMQALSIAHIKAFYPTLAAVTERRSAWWERAAHSDRVVEITEGLTHYTVAQMASRLNGKGANAARAGVYKQLLPFLQLPLSTDACEAVKSIKGIEAAPSIPSVLGSRTIASSLTAINSAKAAANLPS